MKKLSIFAAAAALAAATAVPVSAEEKSNDPFLSTQLSAVPALAIVGGAAFIAVIVAGSSSGTD
ncbi:hypothetical protein KUH32_06025 [Thalassococcus sp. CAU 1522]|uniref:Ferrochelatase n=1 Tax=Thalassococcus arenae TaxID=2851652 RepID=A0ABS6N5M3_9RHOB|nr:hypothetical protein [Thalassococcus arenae]MBV2359321.1 hypothetical protein [Thalassococcus arenae]